MNTIRQYFTGSFIFTIVGVALAAIFLGGAQAAFIALVLGVLEVSLSFDNAVVNAKQLTTMDPVWKQRFLTWGMLIAVFGMRIVFPLLIVAVAAQVGPIEALVLAVNEPARYAEIITAAHISIAAFGGSFLMLVFLSFFFDHEKEVHWIHVLESKLAKLGKIEAIEVAVTLLVLFAVSKMLHPEEVTTFLTAGIMGVVAFVVADGLGALMEPEDAVGVNTVVKSGLAGFLYLELLDASFSFDGVIGAFALTNNIFLIAIGLGIGAMFVRSLTIMLVDKGTLSEFKYLEHGAFYAIGALATIMFVGTFHEVSELVTGLIGAAFICVALVSSIRHNKQTGA